MSYKLSQIAIEIGIEFKGEDTDIDGIHTLSEASDMELSFFNSSKYIDLLPQTKAKAVLIEEKYAHLLPKTTIALITDEPYLKLALASKLFAYKITTQTSPPSIGIDCDIDDSIVFGRDVTIGDSVTILAGSYIGDGVTIGDNTLLHPNITIYHHSQIGSECIIHSGTVIGSDGYGFAHTKTGEHIKIYQNGITIIEDSVEIGANCTIDRAVFGSTYIRTGTKLDNLIQIGHNCDIGEHNLLAGQAGVAGSTTTDRNVIVGGQTAVSGHLNIGAFSTIAGKSGVTKSLEGNNVYSGFPAIEHKQWLRLQARISGLLKKKR